MKEEIYKIRVTMAPRRLEDICGAAFLTTASGEAIVEISPVDAVVLPRNGERIVATLDSRGVAGSLQIGEEEYQVYLSDMEAEQIVSQFNDSFHGPRKSPGCIKRKWVLVEL